MWKKEFEMEGTAQMTKRLTIKLLEKFVLQHPTHDLSNALARAAELFVIGCSTQEYLMVAVCLPPPHSQLGSSYSFETGRL